MSAARGVSRWVVGVAIAGTVAVACGAFWLSFTTLRDLAVRSGIGPGQAWVWPVIVDGVIVVATVSAVALDGAGRGPRGYAWLLLGAGAAISVCANALHAVVVGGVQVPVALAAVVASVPPVVLLAITHLTVLLARSGTPRQLDPPERPGRPNEQPQVPIDLAGSRAGHGGAPARVVPAERHRPRAVGPLPGPARVPAALSSPREVAERWRAEGLSSQQIADRLGVHRTTVSRWLSVPATTPTHLDDDTTLVHDPGQEVSGERRAHPPASRTGDHTTPGAQPDDGGAPIRPA